MTMETKSFSGVFSPVAGPNGTRIDPTSITRKGGKQKKKLVDTSELPDQYKEAVEAEHFIIFGKASVEQYDDDTPSQKIKMEALEDALPQLFKSGLISRRHKDVRVGEVVKTYELEEDRSIQIGDETKEFEKGDVLSTHVEDDEVWLIADIWNDTEIAKDTRLRSLTGDLNGFSVTIYAKETQPTSKGEIVTDVDWHAVTIGSDDKIKNKDSRFGVAEFKAAFQPDDPVTGKSAAGEALRTTASTMWRNLLSKSADETGFNGELLEAASEAAEKAQTDDVELKEAADEVVDDTDLKADDVVEAINILGGATDFKAGDDLEEVLQAVAQGDLSPEEAMQMMADEGGEDEDDEGEMKEEDEEENEEEEDEKSEEEESKSEEEEETKSEEDEKSFEEKLNEHGVVTEDKLDEKLSEVQSNVEETVEKAFEDSVPDADEIAEKMETGSTSDPSGGSGNDRRDYTDEITSAFGGGD